jgi:hydroxymethylpyrimidine/phosphomethylpyrimidine kinase
MFLGMLSSAETIDVIAETLQAHKVPLVVLDPVGYLPTFSWNRTNDS